MTLTGLWLFSQYFIATIFPLAFAGFHQKDYPPNEDWAFYEDLGAMGNYSLYWTIEKDTITFKVEVATKGWIGFGISPDGGIANSDIIIGWVENDKAYLYDYKAKDDVTLLLDKKQDWKLLSGSENKTHTTLVFSRKLQTCDPQDRPLTNDTQRVIFTQYPKDPKSKEMVNIRQTEWMHQSLLIVQPRVYQTEMDKNIRYFEVRADNYTIPGGQETFYYCRIMKGPKLQKKHHIIKLKMFLRPENRHMIHHLSFYRCLPDSKKEAEEAVRYGGTECYQPNAGYPSLFDKCTIYVGIWAIGAGDMIYPQQTGAPLVSDEYFMIEMHYNNEMLHKGIVDDSGIRAYYTPELRKYDASLFVLEISEFTDPTMPIPPGQKEFIFASHANPKCLARGIPKEGINIFTVLLHSHVTGKRMRIRHFRKNKEQPYITADMNYDTMHQWFHRLEKSHHVMSGDQITIECSYDTRRRNSTTFTGLGARSEMCTAVMYYYPVMSISSAESTVSVEIVAGMTGMNLTSNEYVSIPAPGVPNHNYQQYLKGYDWPEEKMCLIQSAFRYAPQPSWCFTTQVERINETRITYPENLKYFTYRDECTGKMVSTAESVFETPCTLKQISAMGAMRLGPDGVQMHGR